MHIHTVATVKLAKLSKPTNYMHWYDFTDEDWETYSNSIIHCWASAALFKYSEEYAQLKCYNESLMLHNKT